MLLQRSDACLSNWLQTKLLKLFCQTDYIYCRWYSRYPYSSTIFSPVIGLKKNQCHQSPWKNVLLLQCKMWNDYSKRLKRRKKVSWRYVLNDLMTMMMEVKWINHPNVQEEKGSCFEWQKKNKSIFKLLSSFQEVRY